MNALKFFLAAALTLALAAPVASAQTSTASSLLSGVSSVLTQTNGNSAGIALLSLYTQYKTTGKIDFSNATTIQNILSLATNIKGLKEQKNTTSFLSGLISGSKNLVNNNNSATALSALGNLSTLDLSEIGKQAATTAATTAATKASSSLLSKLTGGKTTQQTQAPVENENTAQASSILSGLFNSFLGK